MSVWAETPPPMEEILGNVSLYWLTGCFPTSIWIYREVRVHKGGFPLILGVT